MIDLILILALALIAGVVYLTYLAIKVGHKSNQNKRLLRINRQTSRKSQLSGRGWNQLVAKVHGDKAIAQRLINHLKTKHPGQSDRWYIEKAIFDLERDKGRY